MAMPSTSIMITPASAISPVSPINAHFRLPMTHGQTASGEGTGARARVVMPESKERRALEEAGWKVEGGNWGGQGGSRMMGIEMEMEDEEDARTEVGSTEMRMSGEGDVYVAHAMLDLRLPLVRGFLPLAPMYPPSGVAAQQTCRAMRAGTVSQDGLLCGPASITPAPAELAQNNACGKLSPVPSVIPPRQATFFGIQNIPSPMAQVDSPLSVQPACALFPLAPSTLLPESRCLLRVTKWKETQRAKEHADVVVKDGELAVAERIEMEK
ncbi:hypothetical protein BDV93DRAFT_565337 [Ceratobasidium sp. AG-I]|nr:hypothetical protein BDV93DRAFT_565337 [Ceratobasidium sp. AG-I]